MNCPKCGSYNLVVRDSRPSKQSIRRRRHCNDCGHRFNTIEISIADFEARDAIAGVIKGNTAELIVAAEEREKESDSDGILEIQSH